MPPSKWKRVTVACVPFAIIALAPRSATGCAEGSPSDNANLLSPDASRPHKEDAASLGADSAESPSPDGRPAGPPTYAESLDTGADVAVVSDARVFVGTADASCVETVHVTYAGPAIPGTHWIEGWWKWVGGARAWGKISECADPIADDGKLDCAFSVPCGTSPFEFQIYLPDGRFWGDTSFDPTGGMGSTIGTVALSTSKGPLGMTLVPNPKGAPYYNGRVGTIP